MTVSDAQFARFIRHGASSVVTIVEIEFAYESGGVLATGTIYLADRPEAVAGSQPYRDAIQAAPDMERAIDLARLGGRGSRTVGSIVINNTGCAFDYLLEVIIDGRDAAISIGGEGWDRADYRLLGVWTVASVKAPNDGEIVIELRDKNFLLDDTLVGDEISTGPNAGKPKPLILGNVRNVDIGPYLYDTANLRYYINSNSALTSGASTQATSGAAVRDNGASLGPDLTFFSFDNTTMTANAGTDTLTSTVAHGFSTNDVIVFRGASGTPSIFAGLTFSVQYWVIAAGLTANDFRVSLTKGGAAVDITGTVMSGFIEVDRRRYYIDATAGTLELSSSPAGRVTADLVGTIAAGSRLHNAFQFLLENYTTVPADEYDTASMTALATLESSEGATYGRAILDRVNVLTLLDEIATASRSWYAWDESGVLKVGRLDLANLDAATPIDTIDVDDIFGDLACESLALNFGRTFVDTRKNWCVQTDGFAASVLLADRSKWSLNYQNRTMSTDPGTGGYVANWWDYHESAIDSKPIVLPCFTGNATAALVVANGIASLFRPWTRVHRCTVGLDKYALNPGDCVLVTYPRYGLDAGKNCRVVSVRPRVSDRQVDLVLVRQATPDYTTGVH